MAGTSACNFWGSKTRQPNRLELPVWKCLENTTDNVVICCDIVMVCNRIPFCSVCIPFLVVWTSPQTPLALVPIMIISILPPNLYCEKWLKFRPTIPCRDPAESPPQPQPGLLHIIQVVDVCEGFGGQHEIELSIAHLGEALKTGDGRERNTKKSSNMVMPPLIAGFFCYKGIKKGCKNRNENRGCMGLS